MKFIDLRQYLSLDDHEKTDAVCKSTLLLFPVDRDTHEFFCRLQSNVFDAASLFQTNHVVHWNAPHEAIFVACRVMTFWNCVMFIHNMFIFKRKTYHGFCPS